METGNVVPKNLTQVFFKIQLKRKHMWMGLQSSEQDQDMKIGRIGCFCFARRLIILPLTLRWKFLLGSEVLPCLFANKLWSPFHSFTYLSRPIEVVSLRLLISIENIGNVWKLSSSYVVFILLVLMKLFKITFPN